MPRAVICLPTYNERDNLEPILRALGEVLPADGRVLVIDDASPDGTGELADRLAVELPYVEVMHRPRKDGLGPAYIAGFRHALAGGAELVLEMDSDFSHDPADVPRLVAAAEGADLAIGSRYVPGGDIVNWNIVRRFLSRGASLYARIVLGIRIRDATSGFRCYRREVLEAIDLDTIDSRGMVPFQIEIAYRTIRAGFRIVEVPITFVDRVAGGSKMTLGIAAEAAWKVPALRLATIRNRL